MTPAAITDLRHDHGSGFTCFPLPAAMTSAMIMAQAFVILFATATAPARAADPVAIACKEASGRLSASCGPYGNLTCPTNKKKGGVCGLGLSHCRANECCSQYGICGTGKGDCNAVCQCELSGKSSGCNGRLIPDPVLPVVDLASVCGTHIGRCPDNYCCSGYGFCTNNETICNGNGKFPSVNKQSNVATFIACSVSPLPGYQPGSLLVPTWVSVIPF